MKPAALLVGMLVLGAAGAATVEFPPHLSSTQFLRWWRGGPELPAEQSQRMQQEQAYAQGYVAAVVDLTQGKDWCSPAHMQPGERDDRAITSLERAKGDGNAAKLLLAQYVARFPCQ